MIMDSKEFSILSKSFFSKPLDLEIYKTLNLKQSEQQSFVRKHLKKNLGIDIKLGEMLKLAEGSVSISHCNAAVGYAHSTNDFVGFDIEETKRITPKLIARIAKHSEIDLFVFEHLIWSIKEASFKALMCANQPQTISEINIVHAIAHEGYLEFEVEYKNQKLSGIAAKLQSPETDVALAMLI